MAAAGQGLLEVEGEVLHPDAGLPPGLQEVLERDDGNGQVHLQAEINGGEQLSRLMN